MNLKFTIVLLLCYLSHSIAFGQSEGGIAVRTTDNTESILNKYKYKQKANDLGEASLIINELIRALHNDGYLLARIEERSIEDSITFSFSISIGPPFQWLQLSPGNLDALLLRKVAYKGGNFTNRKFSIKELEKLENSILSYTENNGYPFASLGYDSLLVKDNGIKASLNLNLGPLITYDSIRAEGGVLKRPFLESYLGIQQGDPFDMAKVTGSVQRINAMPYTRLQSPPTITYQNEEATISYSLLKRPINTIDGVIGFLPTSGNDNGLLITGQFDMELYNPFQTGKHIGVHWRSPSEQSQMLNMVYEHPNLFRSPVSVAADFEFLKQDTTFSKLNFSLDLDLLVGRAGRMAVFTEFIESNLLSTSQYENATELPEYADISNTLYGLSFLTQSVDDPVLPRTGSLFKIKAGIGNKVVERNEDLPDELYQGVDFESVQYQFDLAYQNYQYLATKWNLKMAFDGGWIENDNLFRNDAYRIGGLNTLRGFDENYYFATKYVKGTLENRFFFDSNSYFLVFADFGYLEAFLEESTNEAFLGFGSGISFQTGRGIFNLIYALGTSESTGAIDLNRSKIHFGFTTRF